MCDVGQSVANGPPLGLLHTKLLLRGLHLVPMFGESIDSSKQITKDLSTYHHAMLVLFFTIFQTLLFIEKCGPLC